MLSQSGKNEHTCLLPNLRDRSVSSSLSIIFAVGGLKMLFSRLKLPPSLSVLITIVIGLSSASLHDHAICLLLIWYVI